MTPPPRTARQRRQDALDRLEHDVDAWVATADPAGGTPYLVPLSFLWDGEALLVATPAHSRYFRIAPRRVQAWREADELVGRDLMRDGRWLVD